MIADATALKTSPFSFIIVHNTNRFARNRFDAVRYKHILSKHGVRVISAMQSFLNQQGPEEVILEGIFESLDEYYSRNLARETLKGMRQHIQAGFWKGGAPPLGYELKIIQTGIKRRSKLAINETEAKTIRRIYALAMDGVGKRGIYKRLREESLKGRSGFIPVNTISFILKNEVYVGTIVYGNPDPIRIENSHPAIITKELFDAVQEKADKKKTIIATKSQKYILSGVLFCSCGSPMVGVSAGGRNKIYYYYSCSSQQRRPGACHEKKLRRDKIENLIISNTKSRILNKDTIKSIIKELIKITNERQKNNFKIREEARKRIADSERRLKNLYDIIESGSVGLKMEDLGDRIRQLKSQIESDKLSLSVSTEPQDFNVSDAATKYFHSVQSIIGDAVFWSSKGTLHSIIEKVQLNRNYIDVIWKIPKLESERLLYRADGGATHSHIRTIFNLNFMYSIKFAA